MHTDSEYLYNLHLGDSVIQLIIYEERPDTIAPISIETDKLSCNVQMLVDEQKKLITDVLFLYTNMAAMTERERHLYLVPKPFENEMLYMSFLQLCFVC